MTSIDYGRGLTNINLETGIRFGCISQHSVTQAWCDSADPDYGEPTCPKCGNTARKVKTRSEASDPPGQWVRVLVDEDIDAFEPYSERGCADYVCESCQITFDSSDAFGDEPLGWSVDDGEYKLADCLDSDIIVIDSPYYTFAPFCSPCVPGAGNLDSAGEGVKTYCLGHDWFENEMAPYQVFRVSDDAEVTVHVALGESRSLQ